MRRDSLFSVGIQMGILVLLISGVSLILGCSSSSTQASTPSRTEIIVFVDFSDSTRKQDRVLYEQAIADQIIPSLSEGHRFLIGPITDKTLTEFHPLVEATFPPKPSFNGWLDNVLKYNRQVKEVDAQVTQLRERIRIEVAEAFGRRYSGGAPLSVEI
jgi:hypothetical protein